ncbi:MAG: molybdopterin cofactor-binding domain-containing protein [Acidimicrobiales bacterium]|nr:molybdopterin cofactor-binding domain-containing protein [Acidimicrobiales bacterium]
MTGSTPHSQGHETSRSQIVADKLGIAPDDVEVLHSDTAISPLGMDTYGSRSLAVGGVAGHGLRQGHRQGPGHRGPPDGGQPRRPRLRRRRVRRGRLAGAVVEVDEGTGETRLVDYIAVDEANG